MKPTDDVSFVYFDPTTGELLGGGHCLRRDLVHRRKAGARILLGPSFTHQMAMEKRVNPQTRRLENKAT